jgi:hypothetical protein
LLEEMLKMPDLTRVKNKPARQNFDRRCFSKQKCPAS